MDRPTQNPAYGYYMTGLASKADSPWELVNSIFDLEAAIRLGLNGEDEAHAKLILGLRYDAVTNWKNEFEAKVR